MDITKFKKYKISKVRQQDGNVVSFHKTCISFSPSTNIEKGNRVDIFFNAEERLMGFQLSETGALKVSRGKAISSMAILRQYKIPVGTRAKMKWFEEYKMWVTEPLPEEK